MWATLRCPFGLVSLRQAGLCRPAITSVQVGFAYTTPREAPHMSTRDKIYIDGAWVPSTGKGSIDVRYTGPLPDRFASGRDVAVQGRLRADGSFDVVDGGIITACPSHSYGSPERAPRAGG